MISITTKVTTGNMLSTCYTHMQSYRHFFGYFRIAFNTVDVDRLQKVGPDRLCAEWLLKNGGAVSFVGRSMVKDYNTLPSEHQRQYIQSVDATESTIMSIGFEHFRNCNKIDKIILHKCKHMENEALEQLGLLKTTLKHLQVSDCYNVVDSGIISLCQLQNLDTLTIFGMPYVKDMKTVEAELRANLPNCQIDISK